MSNNAFAPKTLLLVDDDPAIRSLLTRVLKREGFTVFEAEDGIDALSVANSIPGAIDLLVTDVVMPRMDGVSLAVQLLADHSETKVLYISGFCDERALKTQAHDEYAEFLGKPFGTAELVSKVHQLLQAQ
jgi:two-component system cell cycle sensor histidine kinase/response regulator CckA